jgi:dihydrodipicolinate synthase/N-acetylneuraminate lyase
MKTVPETRQTWMRGLFPGGVPRLWCPLLTHYGPGGAIDFARMEAHLETVAPWVGGYLIPGTTGDGWELDGEETLRVAEFALAQARRRGARLLIGVLKKSAAEVGRTLEALLGVTGPPEEQDDEAAARAWCARGVAGFTFCTPTGSGRTQEEIEAGLSALLERGLPSAFYQLPQVTGNEAAPETFARLAARYPRLVFFKDTSGGDRIALSPVDKGGIFLVRGAEGDYARWLRDSGGPYDGFLLGTTNCFARELATVVKCLEGGDPGRAAAITKRVTDTFDEVFALVGALSGGNAFTNANKAMDHFLAFGPGADVGQGPLLHMGERIPAGILEATREILQRHALLPAKGYLA